MKTNQILCSGDRELFGVTVRQQTENSFLSITDLQHAFEKGKWQYGWTGQTIVQLMHTDELAKKCYGVLLELDMIKIDISMFMEMVDKEGLIPVLKGLGVYKTTGRGKNKQVVAHPYIWMSIAIELNYILYGKVIAWLTDSLVFDRIEAGTEFRPMNGAIKTIVATPNYRLYAKTLNETVFGEHHTGMRNKASSKELRKIADIEKFIINAVNMGWLKNEEDVLNAIKNYSK